MPNIQFNYIYRDSANYKNFGSVIFANPDNIDLKEIKNLIRVKLIDREWFYAEEWRVPEIFPDSFDFNIDPTWHEFEKVEYTDEPADKALSIVAFIKTLKSIKN